MRNQNIEYDDSYNYSPNELAELSINNPREYKAVVESNLDKNDTVELWEQRNLESASRYLAEQRSRRKNN